MKFTLLTRDVVPFFLAVLALVVAAVQVDALLHLVNAVWVGRYFGIPGVLLIVGSFENSLRKRKLIARGNPAKLLRLHERMAWAGWLLVKVQAGIHFNAIPGWLAVWVLLINVGSGLKGKFLLQRSLWRLEGPHATPCATCHINHDTSRFTCFGCHEHQPDAIRAKHVREDIPNFENCAQCHRSTRGEHGERRSGERRDDD
jgi:hypothetical protein